MRKYHALLAAAVLGMITISSARADVVTLKEGDQINGTVTSVADGKMTLTSPVLGDVVIPMEHVRTFSTDGPIELHLADGTVVSQPVKSSDSGDIELTGAGLVAAQKIPVASIEAINPVALTGAFRLGGSLVRGNTFTDNLTAGFDLGYKMKKEDITFTGEYNYGSQKDRTTGAQSTTTDRWDLDGKYEHLFTKKFFGYVEAEVTKDRIAFLDLRFTPSAGIGYNWFDKAPFLFTTEGGIAWIYENYTNATPKREEVALKLAYHLTYDFNPTVTGFHDLTYYPSLRSGSYYLLSADAVCMQS